ncbi:low molecular weight protein-tyrosine-phosphatase [Bacillus songklensis]|uniref:protein-tyrosine-phosphatase n=1 Tax=Bacillus songklensis TaxID=1069116 RepID=A0ABV8B639_9BACI
MVKVLFVCLGNICRSPMAEAVFRDLVRKKGMEDQIIIDSAGTGDWHIGNPPHKGTQAILTKNNINFGGLTARQVKEDDLAEFDYIIGMDTENIGNLRRMAGYNKTGYIGRLLDFVPEAQINDVPDPYFTGNFDEVYDLVKKGCENLLEDILEKHFRV